MLSRRLSKNLDDLGIPEHDFSTWEQFEMCHDGALVYIAKRDEPRGVLLTNDVYWLIVTNIDNVEGATYDL